MEMITKDNETTLELLNWKMTCNKCPRLHLNPDHHIQMEQTLAQIKEGCNNIFHCCIVQ